MKSLFVGNIDNVVKETIKYFDDQDGRKNNDVYRKGKLNYKKLFFCKNYDNVFYFAKSIDNDSDDLNNFLQIVDNSNDVKKYVYIVRSSDFDIDSENDKFDIIKELFISYSKNKNKNIILLNTSCLYSNDFIDGKINSIKNTNKLDNEIGTYIHIEDFIKFLYLLGSHKIDNNYIEFKSDISVSVKELLVNKHIKSNKINCKNLFDFKFEHSIVDDVKNGLNINSIIKEDNSDNNNNIIINLVEVIIMFIISEILVNKFNNTFNIQYVDFRLIFMVIVAIYYNIKYSLLATSLVIISFILTNINTTQDLSYIFSNTDNWLKIVIYIIMTILIRTKIDKYEISYKNANDKIEKLSNEKRIRERNLKKYEIKIKELNRELIIHNNSFSKVASIVENYKIINKESIYKIFLECFNEENIVVIDINDNSHFPKDSQFKISISKLNKLVGKRNIWINRELEENLPLYIVPVFEGDKIIYYVTIWSYDLNIVNNEYKNNLISLSNIISSIKDSDKK